MPTYRRPGSYNWPPRVGSVFHPNPHILQYTSREFCALYPSLQDGVFFVSEIQNEEVILNYFIVKEKREEGKDKKIEMYPGYCDSMITLSLRLLTS